MNIHIFTGSLFVVFCYSTLSHAATLKDGRYTPDDPDTYYDALLKPTVVEGQVTKLAESFDVDGKPSEAEIFTCTEDKCVNDADNTWTISIMSDSQYKDDLDGDVIIYTYKSPMRIQDMILEVGKANKRRN